MLFAKTDRYCRFNDSPLGTTVVLILNYGAKIGWFSFGAVL